MILRDYRPEDFAAICEIDRLCFGPGICYAPEEVAGWLALPGTFAVVAEDEGEKRVAGFVLARKSHLRTAHVVTIDILPKYRGARLGRHLMEEAHRRLRGMGASRVRLEVSVENPGAVEFYGKLGYQTLGRIPRYYLDRIDAWRMAREL
jgi:ribosomal-protein-alanine N-acetyltransferase